MAIRNHYKILDVDYSATEQEIKEAYRILAKKYHPDLNQGDENAGAKFRNVQEAFNCLSDPSSRYEHDALLESKGVDTGKLKRKQEAKARAAAEAAEVERQIREEEEVGEEKRTKAKKDADNISKKFMSRAERAAAAMAKVRERKRFTRIVAITLAGFFFLMAMGGLFGGLAAGGVFVPRYDIYFMVDGEVFDSQRVRRDRFATRPEIPVKEGHRFTDWYTAPQGGDIEPIFWEFSSPLQDGGVTIQNRTLRLYAHWQVIAATPMAEIILIHNFPDSLEEEFSVESSLYEGSASGAISIIRRDGFIFRGWYTSRDFEPSQRIANGVGQGTEGALSNQFLRWQDMTLFARWEPNLIPVNLIIEESAFIRVIYPIPFNSPRDTVIDMPSDWYEHIPYDYELADFLGWYFVPLEGPEVRVIGFRSTEVGGEYKMVLEQPNFRFLNTVSNPLRLYARFRETVNG